MGKKARLHLIVNPAAAGGRVGRHWRRLESRLRVVGLELATTFTRAPGHATELARELLAAGHETLVVAGGDGTLCEAARGVHDAGRGRIAVLPLGTGNDAARAFGVPRRLEEAAHVALGETTRRVDLMRLGDQVVVNAIGLGLLGAINARAAAIKVVRGMAAYLVAATGTLFRHLPADIELRNENFCYRGGMTILAVHNGPTTGGGFRLTPDAVPDDGLLDACLVGPVGIPGRLSRLLSALRGSLGRRRGSYEFSFARLELMTKQSIPAHLDGNAHLVHPPGVTIQVLPAALEVVVPPGKFLTTPNDRARS